MDSDDDVRAHPKLYNALRSDLVAALSAFDRAQDWADLIHDLQRVNRVLNKHESNLLPEKKLLAKRLAQCLTSSLPSGKTPTLSVSMRIADCVLLRQKTDPIPSTFVLAPPLQAST